ncbi:MAG TPA: DUF2461 domain-containing protein [Acidimicrobiia bacterium]|nr:DUF2461 domain-containing protein [Acidimicrobiia bacterium]
MARYFTPATFEFLSELAAHNDRDWFGANKARYLADVQEPALQFIADFAPRLAAISEHLVADPRAQGGSLFRIYRDTRFSKDKTPYKTHVAMRFSHEAGPGVHAPGLYLHIEPAASYAGVGLWRPETALARTIREAIAADPAGWKKAAYAKPFVSRFEPDGESLSRPPQGFPPDHPLIQDLKRRDFIAGTRLDDALVLSARLLAEYTAMNKAAAPYLGFLTRAVGLPF